MPRPAEIVIRPVVFSRDAHALRSLLSRRDAARLDGLRRAEEAGDAYIYIAEERGELLGWVAVHTAYRDDQGWADDGDTRRFQEGDNAYLENIEVAADRRGEGIGSALIMTAEQEAKRRGKKMLWLHVDEANVPAHRFYERCGWRHDSTVYPAWKSHAATRVYKKAV